MYYSSNPSFDLSSHMCAAISTLRMITHIIDPFVYMDRLYREVHIVMLTHFVQQYWFQPADSAALKSLQ